MIYAKLQAQKLQDNWPCALHASLGAALASLGYPPAVSLLPAEWNFPMNQQKGCSLGVGL